MPELCSSCGTQVAAALLVCPGCHSLMHRARLAELARDAQSAQDSGDFARANALWREALTLLPPDSRQYDAIVQRIEACTAAIEGKSIEEMRKGPPPGSMWAKVLGPLGVAGLLLWKLKFLIVILLTKGKLLLLGLTKMSTLVSMFVFLGFSLQTWGWKLGAAILASIYIHEIGHVAELRRRGLRADAPMFVPFFGAFVRLGQKAATPSEDAKIGLAGPIWGLFAGLAALGASYAGDTKFWLAVVYWTATINLFNLTPVWQLDGSRGFNALNRVQRWIALAIIVASWILSREGVLVFIALFAAWRAFEKKQVREPDWNALATFAALVLLLTAMAEYAR